MDIALFGQVTNKISTYPIVAEVCKYLLSTCENITSNVEKSKAILSTCQILSTAKAALLKILAGL